MDGGCLLGDLKGWALKYVADDYFLKTLPPLRSRKKKGSPVQIGMRLVNAKGSQKRNKTMPGQILNAMLQF